MMHLCALALLLVAAPADAQPLPGAIVWLPPENFQRWSEVDALLQSHSKLKITIALTPEMASPLARQTLGPWAAKNRVEIAARIEGDPILTLTASHPSAPRPQDALELASEAHEALSKRIDLAVTGLVIGAGALDAALATTLGASGINWILTGPYADADALWAAAGTTSLVPARPLFEMTGDRWTIPGAAVYDESASTTSVFLAECANVSDRARPALGWSTIAELLKTKVGPHIPISAIAAWPAWDPTAALIPPNDFKARTAWNAYGAAAAAVNQYQNSGAAELKTLEAAVKLLQRASASRHYRGGLSAAENLPAELRTQLLGVYKRLKLPAPETLYTPADAGGISLRSAEAPTGIKILAGTSWLEFRNPAGTSALAPVVNGSTMSADSWRISKLHAQWDESVVRLTLNIGGVQADFPRPVYEIYVDFNHILGAGSIPLLADRGAVVPARDAWELALSIVGSEARLYRARGSGDPEETASFKVEWNDSRNQVAVAVPRAFMRGSPARWGWAVVAFAEDPARADRRPAAPLIGSDGAVLLGLLASTDIQKAVLTRANSRVPAARLEP